MFCFLFYRRTFLNTYRGTLTRSFNQNSKTVDNTVENSTSDANNNNLLLLKRVSDSQDTSIEATASPLVRKNTTLNETDNQSQLTIIVSSQTNNPNMDNISVSTENASQKQQPNNNNIDILSSNSNISNDVQATSTPQTNLRNSSNDKQIEKVNQELIMI